jgi:multiple sugar transport system substrate-binding protein
MRLKFTIPVAVTAAILVLLPAAKGAEARAITLAVGGAPSELDFWEEVVRDFEAKTGVSVELHRQPTDTGLRRQSLMVALQARKSDPDVFLMDVAWLALFAASGWLSPLDRFLSEGGSRGTEVFFARILKLADTFEGKIVALPVYVDGGLLYYREDLLKRHGLSGPPKTWDELVQYSLKVQKAVRRGRPAFHGFVWQGAQYEGLVCNFLEFAGREGGLSERDGTIVVDTPENRRAVRLMRDLIRKYKISPPNTYTEMREEEARLAFQEGNALFERNWPYAWPLHQAADSRVKGVTGIARLPSFTPGGSVSCLGGWHIGISRYSDAPPESWKLVRHLTSYEVQKELALHLGWNPGRSDLYGDPEILAKMPHLGILREVFDDARPRPILPYYSQLSEILQRRLSAALAGDASPEEALSRAQRDIRRVLSRYRRR